MLSFLNCHWRLSVEIAPPYYLSHFDNRTNLDRPTHGKWSIRGSALQTFQTTWLRGNTRRTEEKIWERLIAWTVDRAHIRLADRYRSTRLPILVDWSTRSTLGHVRFLHGQSGGDDRVFVTALTNIERAPSRPEVTCVATKLRSVPNSAENSCARDPPWLLNRRYSSITTAAILCARS